MADPDDDVLHDPDLPPLEDYSSWRQVYPLEHDGDALMYAWHDVTCPEGPDCRDRWLHALSAPLITSGVLARFTERYDELRHEKVRKALR